MGHAAKPLDEEREIFDTLVLDGRQRYRPAGAEEELSVDRLAALWWELQRASAQKQKFLRRRLDEGVPIETAYKECDVFDGKEARLERSIRKERDNLVFLQRLRNGELCKHRRWEMEAHEKMLEALELERDRALFNVSMRDRDREEQRSAAHAAPVPGTAPEHSHPLPATAALAGRERPPAPPGAGSAGRPAAPPPRDPHAAPEVLRVADSALFGTPSGNGRKPESPRRSGD
jgi:hypothetical protein